MAGFDDLIPAAMPYLAIDSVAGTVGASWEWSYTLTDDAGATVDFTGCTGECVIKSTAGGAAVASPTVSFPGGGVVTCAVDAATTDALTAGRYLFEVAVTNGSGEEVVIVGGTDSTFIIKGKVRA